MKKIITLVSLISGIFCHVHAQQFTTVYGNLTGSTGNSNSYFGYAVALFGQGYSNNTGVGASALLNGGPENTAIGSNALKGGHGCTAIGYYALHQNHREYQDLATPKAGYYNTGVGYRSLESNIEGDYNTAMGAESLYKNKTNYNAAFGYHALHENDNGDHNSAVGVWSLYTNTSGYQNTALGSRSLYLNTTGYRNTGIGGYALNSNISGNFNTATGNYAMYSNNFGTHNTGNGYRALYNNTTGNYNTAQGAFALSNSFGGSYNTAVGYNSGPSVDLLNNTIAIGYLSVTTASNQVRIGNTSITSIGGQVEWTAFSDGRFKKDIKEDVSGLEFINELRPVSYTVDKIGLNKFLHVNDSTAKLSDAKSVPVRQTGFVAQEVEALVKKTGYVFYGVDAPENENDPYGIRYAEFVVPLVKGMQELNAILKKQEQRITAQEQTIDSLVIQLGSKSEIEKDVRLNDQAVLFQNNPNPFNTETEIKMTVPEGVGFATVMIYNLEGKQMKNIQVRDRGQVSVKLSGSELSAGMYLYALIADGKVVDTKRMILTQ